ncbi:tandem-95 repeat protein [Polaromonas sp. P2-4]|nr:tandem-95 repeat protein [Polaromonas sp. P2-4]
MAQVDSNLATVNLTITAVNDAPVANAITGTLAEDGALQISLTSNASDIDGDSLAASIVAAPQHGRLVVNGDGSVSYVPDANFNGSDSFTYLVSDGQADSNVATVSITVTPVNDAPTLADGSAATNEDTAVSLSLLAGAYDVDGDALNVAIVNAPSHGTLTINADGTYTYLADADYNGSDSFSYLVSDGQAESRTATISLSVAAVNDAPLAADVAVTTAEDNAVAIDLLANARDVDGDTLTAIIVAGPAHGALTQNANGTYSYTPDANYNGTDSFTYKVSDGTADSNLATVNLTVTAVNDAPVANAITGTLAEDGALQISLTGNASDIDGDTLAANIVAAAQRGRLVVNGDGSVSYVPDANFNGSDSFTYLVNDGQADSNVATVSITVTPVNDAPTLADGSAATNEDTAVSLSLLTGAYDVDGDALNVAIVNGPSHGTLTINADGTYTYLANADYNGSDSFSYLVSDGQAESRIATISLSVAAVNDAPLAADVAVTTAEDNAVAIDLLANARDVDGDTLTAIIVAGPAHGALTQNANGTYSYTPDANYNGTDSFTYKVNDGAADSNLATVNLTITAVNDAPTADNITLGTSEDNAIAVNLLINAADIDSANLSAAIVAGPAYGQLNVNADGSFTYTPHANFNGTDSFTYRVNDGELDSAIATVTLTIAAVNDAPVAQDGQAAISEDSSARIDLLALASDIDSAALVTGIATGPQHGALTANADGTFTYTPNVNFNGVDRFTYKVNDGALDSNLAEVVITVAAVNDAPVLSDSAAQLAEDGIVTLALLASASDVDGDTLTAVIVTGPAHGVLTRNADGSYSYTPHANYNGPDSFTYKVNDGSLDSNLATVSLTVAAINDAPVATTVSAILVEDGSIVLNLLAAVSDVDGDALTISTGNPQSGILVKNADGSYTYRPLANFSGDDSFSYTVSDGRLSASSMVRLTITPAADAPTLSLIDSVRVSRELFRTSWESVTNQTPTFTLVHATQLEGWDLVSAPGNNGSGQHVFEIWSSGDKMPDGNGGPSVVYAASGNGQNWLNLNDGNGAGHDTLGIERSVTTNAGATYTLSFDYAGQVGAGADMTRIGIYVDGVKLASYANISPETALNWQTLSYQFTGTGKAQKIRIVSEPSSTAANGRGAMIDDIALSETLPVNTGLEDTAIPLSSINAALTDTDGSETLTIAINALPAGATLSDGVSSFTASAGNTSADITSWNLGKLTLLPPANFNGTINLSVVATATEQANGNSTVTTVPLTVTVLPVNDAPVVQNASFQLQTDGSVKINFSALIGDADGDVLSLAFANPAHGALTRNTDGSYTYKPAKGYTGIDSFNYTVSDGKLATTARITLNVGQASNFDDRQASIVVQSSLNSDKDDEEYGYVVVSSGASGTTASGTSGNQPRVDWTGSVQQGSELIKANWVADFLGATQDQRSLAEKTGLVVKVKG